MFDARCSTRRSIHRSTDSATRCPLATGAVEHSPRAPPAPCLRSRQRSAALRWAHRRRHGQLTRRTGRLRRRRFGRRARSGWRTRRAGCQNPQLALGATGTTSYGGSNGRFAPHSRTACLGKEAASAGSNVRQEEVFIDRENSVGSADGDGKGARFSDDSGNDQRRCQVLAAIAYSATFRTRLCGPGAAPALIKKSDETFSLPLTHPDINAPAKAPAPPASRNPCAARCAAGSDHLVALISVIVRQLHFDAAAEVVVITNGWPASAAPHPGCVVDPSSSTRFRSSILPSIRSLHQLSEHDQAVLKYLLWGDHRLAVRRTRVRQQQRAGVARPGSSRCDDARKRPRTVAGARPLRARAAGDRLARRPESAQEELFINIPGNAAARKYRR